MRIDAGALDRQVEQLSEYGSDVVWRVYDFLRLEGREPFAFVIKGVNLHGYSFRKQASTEDGHDG
jgi:hypothetical protein